MTEQEAKLAIKDEWLGMLSRLSNCGSEEVEVWFDQMDDTVYVSFKHRAEGPSPPEGMKPWWAWVTDVKLNDVFPT